MSAPALAAAWAAGIGTFAYLLGGVPWAYFIVRWTTGEDITDHGTGNVGAMNVRRSTGSWGWFTVAMFADGSKGIIAVAVARATFSWWGPAVAVARVPDWAMLALAVVASVLGHNYSVWLALLERRFVRTGKGLATGGGALLVYDPVYFVVVAVVALATIAITRYLMAGQVAAAVTLPVTSLALRAPDWPFCVALGLIVYAAHHRRFLGLLRGEEPRMYIRDRMGPRG